MTFTRFALDKRTPSLWRVTFCNPPINLIDYTMIRELSQLLADIEENEEPAVLMFESADRDYFLAHYDIAGDHSLVNSQKGPTGFHPWIDVLLRLSRLPAVTISAIRGRVRGAGSEFVLACDIRFASLERAVSRAHRCGSTRRRSRRETHRPPAQSSSFAAVNRARALDGATAP